MAAAPSFSVAARLGAVAVFALLAAPRAARAQSCTNTCFYAFDGDCDDGGAGALTSACLFGTDCGDCGVRGGEGAAAGAGLYSGCGEADADAEPVEVCENTCLSAFDGVCDEPSLCPPGSDCADCEPVELSPAELGGCRGASGSTSTLVVLLALAAALRLGRRWRGVGLVLAIHVLQPHAALANPELEDAVGGEAPVPQVRGAGLDLAFGVGAGALLSGSEGGGHIGPRARASFHAALAPTALVGFGATAQVGLLIYRAARGQEAEQLVGGRGHLDLFLTGCATHMGLDGGTCVDAGGFVGLSAAGPVARGRESLLGGSAGPLVVFHAGPRFDGHRSRALRLELGWDLVRDLFEIRLGFELGSP